MGQIIGSAAKPKRCNINQLSQVPTPAAGEYILVSSDNSMNAAGQGNCDCYIVGDGTTSASALELKNLADNVPTSGSKNSVSSGGVYNELHSHSVITNQDITPTTTKGYFFSVSNSKIKITANSGSFYTSFGGDTSSPVGIDISAYVGSSIVCKLAGNKSASSVRSLIVATESNAILGFVKEQDYTLGSDGKYYASLTIPQGAKYVYWSAVVDLYSMEIVRSEEFVGITDRVEALEDAAHSFVTVAEREIKEYDLALTDVNRNAVAIFKDGHIKTKNFDSSKIENDPTEYAYTYEGEKISFGRQNYLNVSQLFTITPASSGLTQGCACYGGYLFAANDFMAQISIYDLSTNQLVNVITFEQDTQLHCNTIAFGKWKYDAADFSPCLYISQERSSQRKCMVFQVTYNGSTFSLTKVQEINYPTLNGSGLYYPNCMIDAQNGVMYIMSYSTNSYQQNDATKLIILKYNLPLPSIGDVTLLEAGLLDKKEVPSEYATQGGFINYGKLYQVFGMPPQTYLIVRQVGGDWTLCNRIPLSTIGISYEPEAVCFNNDNLLIVDAANQVFKLTFKA